MYNIEILVSRTDPYEGGEGSMTQDTLSLSAKHNKQNRLKARKLNHNKFSLF